MSGPDISFDSDGNIRLPAWTPEAQARATRGTNHYLRERKAKALGAAVGAAAGAWGGYKTGKRTGDYSYMGQAVPYGMVGALAGSLIEGGRYAAGEAMHAIRKRMQQRRMARQALSEVPYPRWYFTAVSAAGLSYRPARIRGGR